MASSIPFSPVSQMLKLAQEKRSDPHRCHIINWWKYWMWSLVLHTLSPESHSLLSGTLCPGSWPQPVCDGEGRSAEEGLCWCWMGEGLLRAFQRPDNSLDILHPSPSLKVPRICKGRSTVDLQKRKMSLGEAKTFVQGHGC